MSTTDPIATARTFVVTGANSGLGLVTSRRPARSGQRVIMAIRRIFGPDGFQEYRGRATVVSPSGRAQDEATAGGSGACRPSSRA